MTDTPASMGDNFPPLDPPERITARLEREHAALLSEAANLEAESYGLPETPATDEEAAQVSDHIVKVKRVAAKLEDARTEAGRPYLEGQRNINTLFNDYRGPLVDKKTGLVDRLSERVGIYNRAKEERERGERLERERLAREEAEAQRREEQRLRDVAEAAERAEQEAAARLRAAADQKARDAAQAEMQRQSAAAAAARKGADGAEKAAEKSERRADVDARVAAAPTGALGRVSAAGSTSSVTKFWTHTITDAGALMKSLGPLAEYLSNDTISQALARAVRERAAAGSIENYVVPGVRFWQDSRTNVRAARGS